MTDHRGTAGRRAVRRGPEVRCRTGVPAGRPAAAPAASAVLGGPSHGASAHGAATCAGPAQLRTELTAAHGTTTVVAVAGEIDLRTADALRAELTGLAGLKDGPACTDLVLDFGGVRFCDASGVGVLVSVRNALVARGGRLRLARVRPAQLRLLRVVGLDTLFPLHADVAGAVAAAEAATAGRG
ncbi:STAS domain-containing protein [Actinomadura rupiterrae]|uniref:STAS domain-containing protein n=1 Tax=Actinomadura rupiterrae TaxID=559627 RepID=UPI0020A2B2E6|nr:STAS domain-containing protein [Actinomadura rupiterrae]MCP2340832.1 anti-anti-sigma factor [Actinomadura rupiterrae]